jgi:cell division protease FtsH
VQKKGRDTRKNLLTSAPIVLVLLLVLSSLAWTLGRETSTRELSYGGLWDLLRADVPGVRFQNVSIRRGAEIRGELVVTDTVSDGTLKPERVSEVRPFYTRIVGAGTADGELIKRLSERVGPGLVVQDEESVGMRFQQFVMPLVVFLLLGVTGFFVVRWLAGGNSPLTFGRSRHKLYAQKDLKVTFDDVAGIEEALAELREIVDFLKNPEKYQALGGRIPKGVLLVGPPGTGKTLLAKAVAGEADVPFFSLSGSDFVEMFVGVGASRVRDLFGQAEQRAPCIVFIDELDALGKTRGGHAVGGHDEREQTLNQLLVEMDGFDSNAGVILMAATNRPETLDPALLRPGRFDRQVVVDRPDLHGREAILRVHVRNVRMADDVDLRHVASLTPGSVGADLANIVNEAALLAARKSRGKVTMADFNEAIERGAIGLERKSRIMTQDEKLRVAYHEGGHAIVACALPNSHPVHKVTIIPRGVGALGYVLQRPEDDRHMQTRGELESAIRSALGGTIAEELVYGEIANGATSDLSHCNRIARRMVTAFGMSQLGRVYYHDEEATFLKGSGGMLGGRDHSEQTAREVDLEVRKIIETAVEDVRAILTSRRSALDAVAKQLLEREVIEGNELRQLLEEHYPGPTLVPGSVAIKSTDRKDGARDDKEVRETAP